MWTRTKRTNRLPEIAIAHFRATVVYRARRGTVGTGGAGVVTMPSILATAQGGSVHLGGRAARTPRGTCGSSGPSSGTTMRNASGFPQRRRTGRRVPNHRCGREDGPYRLRLDADVTEDRKSTR